MMDKDCLPLAGIDVRKIVLGDGVQGQSPTLPGSVNGQAQFPALTLLTWRDGNEVPVPRVVGIHLFANKQEPSPGGAVPRRNQVQALVTWGHTGGKFQAIVDVLQGTTFSVFASFVDVQAINTSDTVAAIAASTIPIAGVICPEGPLAGQYPPRRSFAFTGAAATVLQIPLFARELDIIRTVSAGVAVVVSFLEFGGATTIAQFTIPAGSDLLNRPFPIPQGAVTVSIAAVGSGECEAIFYLDL